MKTQILYKRANLKRQYNKGFLVRNSLLCLIVLFSFQIHAGGQTEISVTYTKDIGNFTLAEEGAATALIFDTLDAEVVSVAADAFRSDIQLITGSQLIILNNIEGHSRPVIIGTLGQSEFIDSLATMGKIPVADVSGKWETFCITIVSNPFDEVDTALVIFGSDPRGTAFGIFELSRIIGVSPLVWWSDILPEEHSSLYITPGESIFGPPSVKYRGLFINDEDWGLLPWAANKMDTDIKDIGPDTYAKVFELLLRLKANYIWPAMHDCTKAFWYYQGNPAMARRYNIVLGSSHCEQMLRNNVFEWGNEGFADSDYNWATNKTGVTNYWETRVIESKNNDAVYTLGMRGVHDSGLPGYSNNTDKVNALKDIITTQRNMLTTNFEKPASDVPQMYCPYKEALTLYNLGLDLADDITLTWVDDNHGYIRQLSTPEEQLRSGGAGVYYHISFWGDPEDYLWLSSVSPSLISFELSKAYELKARNLWVINVGDIKPAEMEFQFTMDMAWDKSKWGPDNAAMYSELWASETFGSEFAEDIAKIKKEYYRLAAAGKPEHITMISYSAQEMYQRLADYEQLVALSKQVEATIPTRLQDAYYQLIAYPVEAAASMNEKQLGAKISLRLASEGNMEALEYANKANAAYQNIIALTNKYNKNIANGKWDGIMDYAPRKRSQFYEPVVATASSITEGGIPPESEDSVTIIPAQNFTSKSDAGYTINPIIGLGENGCAITVWPMNMTTYAENNIKTAPYVEYDVPVKEGENKITVKCLPSFPLYSEMQLRYAITMDGGTPSFVTIATSAGDAAWTQNVIYGCTSNDVSYQSDTDKEIKVRIYFSDPGLVVSSLAVSHLQDAENSYTEFLSNPNFEYKSAGVLNDGSVVRGTPYGWNQKGTVVGNSFGINNDAANYDGSNMCWYNVNQSPYAMPNNFELYQITDDLPAGEYIVRCRLAVMSGYETNVRLFANNYVQYYGSESQYVSNLTADEINSFAGLTSVSGMSSALLSEMAVRVIVNEGDSLKLGIRSSNITSNGTSATGSSSSRVYGGFKVDHFRLELVKGYTDLEKAQNRLSSLIAAAQELYDTTALATNIAYYPEASRNTFASAIQVAIAVSDNENLTIDDYENAEKALQSAISVYKASKVSITTALINPGFENNDIFIQITHIDKKVCVNVDRMFSNGNVKVYTLTGQVLIDKEIYDSKTYIRLPSGFYIIKVIVDGNIKISKTVI